MSDMRHHLQEGHGLDISGEEHHGGRLSFGALDARHEDEHTGGVWNEAGEKHDHEGDGPPNDDYINKAYQDMAGPNPHGRDRPANPHWTSTFNDRRTGPRR